TTDPNSFGGPFPNQAAVVSKDNGLTWAVNVIPGSTSTLRSDPSTAADAVSKWYFGYEDGVNSGGSQVAGLAKISTSPDGTTWSSTKRNLLDFMDITVDNHGRVLVGYADGCTGTCVADQGQACSDPNCANGPTGSRDTLVSIARQTCGEGLNAQFDTQLACTS